MNSNWRVQSREKRKFKVKVSNKVGMSKSQQRIFKNQEIQNIENFRGSKISA